MAGYPDKRACDLLDDSIMLVADSVVGIAKVAYRLSESDVQLLLDTTSFIVNRITSLHVFDDKSAILQSTSSEYIWLLDLDSLEVMVLMTVKHKVRQMLHHHGFLQNRTIFSHAIFQKLNAGRTFDHDSLV